MGKVYLCQGSYANAPYSIRGGHMRLYSIEELCVWLWENAVVLEPDVINMSLSEWIAKECNLPELADKIRPFIVSRGALSDLVAEILGYVGLYGKAEIRRAKEIIERQAKCSSAEKKNLMAGHWIRRKKYRFALNDYEACLDELSDNDAILPAIYHNMGVAYTGLFEFKKAAEMFEKAYYISKNEESKLQFLCAVYMYLGKDKYLEFVIDNGFYDESLIAWKRIEEMLSGWESSDGKRKVDEIAMLRGGLSEGGFYKRLDNVIKTYKDEYRGII